MSETHKIVSCPELVPGGSIQFKNILNKDQAESIGPGVQSYLSNIHQHGVIQVRSIHLEFRYPTDIVPILISFQK